MPATAATPAPSGDPTTAIARATALAVVQLDAELHAKLAQVLTSGEVLALARHFTARGFAAAQLPQVRRVR